MEKVLAHPNMNVITSAEPTEVKGDTFVTGLEYNDIVKNEKREIPVTGVFVEIGSIPTTSFVKDVVDTDDYDHITIDPWTGRTSQTGIWAAGDCTNILYHQNNIAAGDAVKALEDLYLWLRA